ncbi:MAG: membrane dipeptidase [Bacteroidota bacterium]
MVNSNLPLVDLHCDLLGYLAMVDGATAFDAEVIGCAVPHLQAGRVKLQVMAHFTPTKPGSTEMGMRQAMKWRELLETGTFVSWQDHLGEKELKAEDGIIYGWPSIENASNFAEEDEPLKRAFARLEQLISLVGRPLYIGLTHHPENRFAGGNKSEMGLKDDGRILLEYLNGRGIAIDFSHTSDATAQGILDHIDAKGLDIKLMASHSNYRSVHNHKRNLPDDYVRELVRRGGLIGVNFVRDFLDPEDPDTLYAHLRHGLHLGAGGSIAWGMDYFPPSLLNPRDLTLRAPIFHPAHDHAGLVPGLMARMPEEVPGIDLEAFAFRNALRFFAR